MFTLANNTIIKGLLYIKPNVAKYSIGLAWNRMNQFQKLDSDNEWYHYLNRLKCDGLISIGCPSIDCPNNAPFYVPNSIYRTGYLDNQELSIRTMKDHKVVVTGIINLDYTESKFMPKLILKNINIIGKEEDFL